MTNTDKLAALLRAVYPDETQEAHVAEIALCVAVDDHPLNRILAYIEAEKTSAFEAGGLDAMQFPARLMAREARDKALEEAGQLAALKSGV